MKNSQLLQFILSSFVLFILGFGFTANAQAYFCGSTAKGGMGRVGYCTGQFRTAGSGPCTGQAVLNCVNDAYSNHGWASVWAWVQSAFMPATVAAISAACFTKICIPH